MNFSCVNCISLIKDGLMVSRGAMEKCRQTFHFQRHENELPVKFQWFNVNSILWDDTLARIIGTFSDGGRIGTFNFQNMATFSSPSEFRSISRRHPSFSGHQHDRERDFSVVGGNIIEAGCPSNGRCFESASVHWKSGIGSRVAIAAFLNENLSLFSWVVNWSGALS
jgi:hypothetical protein